MNTFARGETMAVPTALEAPFHHLDARTLQVLQARRAGNLTLNRGWLVRRALLLADVVGLRSRS